MSGLKQEMKRGIAENNNYMIPGNMVNQGQYWPQLPAVPVMPLTSTTQQDQDSIRNLLVKLGGRFSDENPVQSSTAAAAMNLRYPVEVSFGHHQDQNIYDNSMNIISPSSSLSPINSSSCSEVINSSNFNVNEAAAVAAVPNSNMFQGLDGFPTDLTELIYGLDTGFYGTDGSSTSGSGISSVESSSWGSGDINSLSYSQMASGFEACQQPNMAQVVQVSTFDESSYFGPQ
ncbi:hypothetical protein CCACVL1_00563 [Corchorus capsularis]|uniref:Uncharacterized protein n=1 Tax=Corchorus capsularis TaxID=210143 RepID=A0A1R3KWB1_COCAP|nr:hypothetical protein CCACVL1_00563 [Corchorus capsularis]